MVETACVIGGGIHGMMTAIALQAAGFKVIILEKNKNILEGTSGATHNRAHMGYHYPRSIETAKECIDGLNYFNEKYPSALYFPKDVYYIIEKNSKTSVAEYKQFCNNMNIPYIEELPLEYIKPGLIESGFKVSEPIFDINILRKNLNKQIKENNIRLKTSTELVSFKPYLGGYKLICTKHNKIQSYYANIIVNATYAYANNILSILDLEEDMSEYRLQHTEVAIVKSKKYLPSITVMDGPHVSLMPYANRKNLYLLYDVVNSVHEEKIGFFFKDKTFKSNIQNMLDHCSLYFNFDLKYIDSLYGSRPIPTKISDDARTTRIIKHKKYKSVYSILEGKFISAPLIAEALVSLIKEEKA